MVSQFLLSSIKALRGLPEAILGTTTIGHPCRRKAHLHYFDKASLLSSMSSKEFSQVGGCSYPSQTSAEKGGWTCPGHSQIPFLDFCQVKAGFHKSIGFSRPLSPKRICGVSLELSESAE